MALSSRALELLRLVKEEGSMEALEIQEDHSFELVTDDVADGSMTDASKRRMDQPLVDPRVKAVKSENPCKTESPDLPPGIQSMEEWGQTLLTTGKYGKDGLSYAEMVSSSRKEHVSDCQFMLSNHGREDLTPPTRDLVNFFKMHRNASMPKYFPGSQMIRQMKK